jgi:hypothetical protein
MAMTTYTAGPGRWQNFGFVDAGGGYYNIKWQFNPNYCVSAGTNTGSNVGVIVPCNAGDVRQRFRVGQSTITYEAWMTARYSQKSNVFSMIIGAAFAVAQSKGPEVGHAWVSLNKKITIINSYNVTDNYGVSTLSYWPNSGKPDNQNPNDVNNTLNSLGLTTPSGLKTGIRKAKISESRYLQLLGTTPSQYGCQNYVADNPNGSGPCTCITQTMRIWNNLTGENWTGFILPDELADSINTYNSSHTGNGYANNGNIIP